jgi:hypothetical protein
MVIKMIKSINPNVLLVAAAIALSPLTMPLPASAQVNSGGATGLPGNSFSNGITGFQSGQSPVGNPSEQVQGQTYPTNTQATNTPLVGTPGGAPGSPGPTLGLGGTGYTQGSLPPTTLDSFVYNSGYDDSIYGDEGSYGPPPYWDFSTIGSGMGAYGGLSTGHSSPLPSSWGYTSGTY